MLDLDTRELTKRKKSEIDKAIFASLPFIIVDEMKTWNNWGKWDIDFFKEKYERQTVKITNMRTGKDEEVSMGEFLREGKYQDENSDFYLRNWQFSLNCPELLDEYPRLEAFQSWLEHIPPEMRPILQWIFIGGEKTGCPLHVDICGTSAWNALFQGEKEWIIVRPEKDLRLSMKINLFDCSTSHLEELGCQVIYKHIQTPGEIMFVPPLWWHQTRNLNQTVTLTENFVNASNIQCFIEEANKGNDINELLIAKAFQNEKWKTKYL